MLKEDDLNRLAYEKSKDKGAIGQPHYFDGFCDGYNKGNEDSKTIIAEIDDENIELHKQVLELRTELINLSKKDIPE